MRRRGFLIALVCMLVLIACTRLPILTHEMRNHPDEHVFVQGATSLRDALLYGSEFTETKPYPEGSYFFYLPFQLLAALVGRLSGIEQNARVWNRIAAVFYFALGGAAGLKILQKHFGGGKALFVYALLLAFSLLHMEQSRFGTGDAISFALLMLMIHCTAAWVCGGRVLWLYAAAVLVGALGAVKYPQLFFALVPLGAVLTSRKGARQRWGLVAAGVGLVCLGFLALSPGVVKDIGYIIDVTRLEIKAYMLMGNRSEVGGPLNHAFAVLMYWLGYSDLLLAPVFAVFGLRAVLKKGERTPEKAFFGIVLPAAAGLFLLYNLFVTALFMRTLYPFFGIALLYTAAGAAKLLESRRALAGALVGLTVLRGCILFGAYLPQTQAQKLDGYIEQAQQVSGGGRMIGLITNRYMTGHWTEFMEKYPQIELVELDELRRGEYPEMESGDIVVTGPLEMARAKPYLFPISDEGGQACIDGWAKFKQENAEHYIGQSYPQWYAPLFGFWINGVVAEFDFPMNFVYAAP